VRSAVIIKEGISYFTGTWSHRGWYTLSPGECFTVGGSSWLGGSRAWGYISVEEERTEQEIILLEKLAETRHLQNKLEAMRDRTKKEIAYLNKLSFYDRLMLYLPGTRQRAGLAALDADLHVVLKAQEEEKGEIGKWRFHRYEDEKPNPIGEQGMDGTNYKTCLPSYGFSYDTEGLPDDAETCTGERRLVRFALEFFVTPDGTLLLTIDKDGVKSRLRY